MIMDDECRDDYYGYDYNLVRTVNSIINYLCLFIIIYSCLLSNILSHYVAYLQVY
jgi:hypothetical protein